MGYVVWLKDWYFLSFNQAMYPIIVCVAHEWFKSVSMEAVNSSKGKAIAAQMLQIYFSVATKTIYWSIETFALETIFKV